MRLSFQTLQPALPMRAAFIPLVAAFLTTSLRAEEPLHLSPSNSFPVVIHVDAAKSMGQLRAIWRFFGGDEPNYATMKDGQKLLTDLGKLRPKEIYFRTHNLLTSGDGTPALKWGSTGVYDEDANGKPIYNWTVLDAIFDSYLARGVRPYAQIGFMPKALSVRPEPYRHEWRPGLDYGRIYTGWTYPPKDYAKWGELVYQWTRHCVDRYGREEVEKWYWETWNEPNIGYWRGTSNEFHKLHDYAIDGVRRALPTARVKFFAHVFRALLARDQLRHRQDRHAARFRFVPRQGRTGLHQRPRAHGHRHSIAQY